ncbi:uncharacterized protein FA14DRAFT_64902 [Meira miltonrushii]|uniref:Uncharacterized protein n=1 Tax=Meira miltonrushii TaxID=1280837 RepID=A0A316VBT9_9BASI|nr:uncharacterized protein FA14DRAFT_64902 [Meira miltonrushii]PWN33723.1 hypothetical protein FA14DRAFT_64902 [Meira miltonrushii]
MTHIGVLIASHTKPGRAVFLFWLKDINITTNFSMQITHFLSLKFITALDRCSRFEFHFSFIIIQNPSMRVFYLFFLFLFLSMTLTDAVPANGKIRSMLGIGKKKAAPAPAPAVQKKPSFSDPAPNIPKSPTAGATTHKSSGENVKNFHGKIDKALNTADAQRRKNQSAGNQAGVNANRRTEHYMAHNRNEVTKASNSGDKIAVSRSPSGRNDLYHAVPRG